MNAAAERVNSSRTTPERPLIGNQERFWFLHQYEEDPSVLSLGTVLEVTGVITDDELTAAIRRLMEQCPQLSTRFRSTAEGVRAQVSPSPIVVVKRSVLERADRACVEARVRSAMKTPLDIEKGQTAAFEIMRADSRVWLCIRLHPCVADGRSPTLVCEALAGALANSSTAGWCPAEPAEPNAMWSYDEDAERYWQDRVGIDPLPLEFPRFVPRLARKAHATGTVALDLSAPLLEALRALATRSGSSLEQVGCATFVATLRRWTRQETVIIGRSVDRRPQGFEDAIGAYENWLPVRIDFPPSTSFASLLAHIDRETGDALPFEGVPFDRLARSLQRSRDTSRHAVFQAFYRFDSRKTLSTCVGDVVLSERRDLVPDLSPFDISFELVVADDRQRVRLTYDAALFEQDAMTRFVAHWANIVSGANAAPEMLVDSLPLLTGAETTRQLEHLNVARVHSPALTCVDLLRNAAQRSPSAAAVTFGNTTLSYGELDALTDGLAARLRALGVTTDVCVGVCVERSIEMIASVLAVLKAGGAYVPMDPSYPRQRLEVMVQDTSAPLIIVDKHTEGMLGTDLGGAARILAYEELRAEASADTSQPTVTPESLAYVIFTSGSTGRPKGVAMPHRALANLIEWQLARRSFRPGARVLQYSSLSFDVSFQELFSTWASGGHLQLIADAERRDPRRLLGALEEAHIERLFLPYVALRQLVEVARTTNRYPRTLREVITAGEQLRVDDALREFFRKLEGSSLDNQYGPSETHVVTAELLEGDPTRWPDLPPIGRPIDNTQVFLLDAHGSLVPEGVTGEIFLAGTCVAHGYLGRDDLTRERFVLHPFADDIMRADADPLSANDEHVGANDEHVGANGDHVGAISRSRSIPKAYKTGDLGRYLPNGAIEFLGRADQQVKIRGYRIEPGEIDTVLGELPGVKASITKVVEDGGGKRLVSYMLVDQPRDFDRAAAIAFAKRRLPEYMVPTMIVAMDAFPFTPSGKVDVRALALPEESAARSTQIVAPRTDTERELADIWKRVLHVNDVGVHDSFFDLGGDSLRAVDLFLEIEKRFSQDLPLALLAEHPTIEALASIIDRGGAHEMSRFRSLRVIQRGDDAVTPLFLVHGGGGNVVIFRELARRLPRSQPVYAFEWDGWSRYRGQTNIPAMAQLYAAELTAFRPKGPIRLGGHCIGGLIAIEMARSLQAAGREIVGPLIITDTPNLASSTHRAEVATSGPELERFEALRAEVHDRLSGTVPGEPSPHSVPRRSMAHVRLVRLARRLHGIISKGRFNKGAFERNVDAWRVRLCLWTGMPIASELRTAYCSRTMIAAARRFRSTGYDGDVLYFRTKVLLGSEMGLPGWWTDPYLGFEELCRGEFSAHFVNADHNAVVGHLHTSEIIRRVLNPV